MKAAAAAGVFEDRGFVWTRNRDPGRSVYGERLRSRRGQEYRNWNPFRSKMAALVKQRPRAPWPDPGRDILYLGAASGTTVSHLSDILADGACVFAVESSPRSARDLLWNLSRRPNVIPILDDARRPEHYAAYLDRRVGTLVQDVAQRDQVDIFLANLPLLAPDGLGFLFVKARSIHVAAEPRAIYAGVEARLQEEGLNVKDSVDLEPYEKDHRVYIVGHGHG